MIKNQNLRINEAEEGAKIQTKGIKSYPMKL
jgi:hypothetical protein